MDKRQKKTTRKDRVSGPSADVKNALKKATRNRFSIKEHTMCGCYHCLSIVAGHEITEWADKGETAICPKCGVDSVIPGATDEEYLKKANAYWFH